MPVAVYKQPILGLVAFLVAFLSQWLGHSLYTFLKVTFGDFYYYASFLVGVSGAAIIAAGLKKDEITATWMGFVGAQFVWVGWFELTFALYAKLFNYPVYVAAPGLEAAPSATVLMGTLPVMFTILLIYGFYNKETKCNLMRWFHRNLRVSPGMPTAEAQRSFARITAMEYLFVVWTCYLFWLYVSYIGANQTVMMVAYGIWATWFVYIFTKLMKFPRVGATFRYAIAVGIVGWGLMEMPSYFGFYDEVWLKPFEYPLTTLIVVALQIGGIAYLANPPGRSPPNGDAAAVAA